MVFGVADESPWAERLHQNTHKPSNTGTGVLKPAAETTRLKQDIQSGIDEER